MRVVVADAGPLNYLLLIDHVDLMPRLFEVVHIPDAVCAELADDAAPRTVRDWISQPPSWLLISPAPVVAAPSARLDAGEQAAIALAVEFKAGLLLKDDRAGVTAARAQGFIVTGTLGILARAASAGLVDLSLALARLTTTNFHVRPELIQALLVKYPARS